MSEALTYKLKVAACCTKIDELNNYVTRNAAFVNHPVMNLFRGRST
jgi:hypothetical protein